MMGFQLREDTDMATIRAAHYDETEKTYTEDPIVIQMASEIPDDLIDGFTHDNGSANHQFMMMANHEYGNRGGEVHGHIGAIAAAILILKNK